MYKNGIDYPRSSAGTFSNNDLSCSMCITKNGYKLTASICNDNECKTTLKMYGDVGIAEQQKVRKQAGMMA